jgi:hypothetical protein
MTHGFLYRIDATQALGFSAWSSHKRVRPPLSGVDVVSVHVRIRQNDTGVLYRLNGGIEKIPLVPYQPGEYLDWYA